MSGSVNINLLCLLIIIFIRWIQTSLKLLFWYNVNGVAALSIQPYALSDKRQRVSVAFPSN
jgi:hypothetical protein